VADENSLMMIVYQGNNYQIRVGDLLSVTGVPITRQVIAGTGLTGGGALSSNVTLSVAVGGIGGTQLNSTGVTPGVYGNSTNIPVFTVDTNGRVSAATTIQAAVPSVTGTPDQIAISAGPTVAIASNPVLPGSGGVVVPAGTTGQRGTAVDGNFRYNSTTASFEGYANGLWGTIPSGVGVNSISFGTTGLTPATATTGSVTVAGVLAIANGGTGNTSGTATVNANLTGAVTSVGNATSLGSFTSAQLLAALTNETGTGVAVFGTSPTITTSLGTGSTTFALINTNATTINFGGAATAVNIGAATGTATVNNTTLAAKAITASTTLGVTGLSTLSSGAIVQGLTVGLGGSAVATNTSIGYQVLGTNTSGSNNTGVGYNALLNNNTGSSNTGIGYLALTNTTDSSNTGIGSTALLNNTTGNYNTGVGDSALYSNVVGIRNVAVGADALVQNTGSFNTACGSGALGTTTTGSNNTAIGYNSGNAITTGANNVVVGSYTGSAAPISAIGSNYIVLSDGAGTVRQTIDPSGNVSFTGGITSRVVVIADATSVTVNTDTTDIATQANTQAVGTLTVNAPTGTAVNGQKFILRLTSTNVQTFAWNAVFAGSVDITLPTVSSGGGKTDYLGFIYNSTAAKWQMIAKVFGF
jgi:hypothetical protein